MQLQRQWVRIGFVWETFYISAAPSSSSSCFSVFWNKWNHLKEPPCNIFQPGTSCGSHLAKTARLQRSSRLSGLPPPSYLRLSPSRWRVVIFWKIYIYKIHLWKIHIWKYTWQKKLLLNILLQNTDLPPHHLRWCPSRWRADTFSSPGCEKWATQSSRCPYCLRRPSKQLHCKQAVFVR